MTFGSTLRCTNFRGCGRARRQAAQAKKAAKLRKPPSLPARPGRCSMCGTSPLPPRRRSWCSDSCVTLWNIATSSRLAFYWLSAETGPICWVCWDEPAVEVDHVRPLWSLGARERGEVRWWLPFNLQLIGRRCHRAKTKAEAGDRAAGLGPRRVVRHYGDAHQLSLGSSS